MARESQEHRNCRHAVRELEARVLDVGKIRFAASDLKKARVRAVKVPFDEDRRAKISPCFFDPYPVELLPDANVFRDKEDKWNCLQDFPEYDPCSELNTPSGCALEAYNYISEYQSSCRHFLERQGHPPAGEWRYKDVCDYKFRGPLDEFPRQEITDPDYYWYANGVLHVPGFRSPHMKASMLYNIDGDDCILRGELLVLVRMMEKHLNTAQLTDHLLVPVLLFSYMGPQHGRIIQAYFDGKELVVYYSKLYDFRHEANAPAKLFASWGLSNQVGNTRSFPQ